MRTLYYVPVIHGQADFGALGPALARALKAQPGAGRWERHAAALEAFWRSVEACLLSAEPSPQKVYQDGLPRGGLEGRRLIEEAARRGSRNHLLVLKLLDRGAEAMQTEEPDLLLQEYEQLARSVQSAPAKAAAPLPRQGEEPPTGARDRAIASNIAATLERQQTAVLFLGAAHDIFPLLPQDITVRPLKDRGQVLEYFQELLSGQDDKRFESLACHLAAPINAWAKRS